MSELRYSLDHAFAFKLFACECPQLGDSASSTEGHPPVAHQKVELMRRAEKMQFDCVTLFIVQERPSGHSPTLQT